MFATLGGLGIIGANNLLRVPDRTNVRVFIGTLFVNADLPNVIHDVKMPFGCEDCLACIINCPTDAIRPGKPIDAPRCISYLTIEKRSVLSRVEAEMMGDWIFGCDECSNVCPPKEKIDSRIPVDLAWLLKQPAGEIRRTIKGNATAYAGVTQLRRNAVAMLKLREDPVAKELLGWTARQSGSALIQEQLRAW
jgi:epoxyqueuosine reductase